MTRSESGHALMASRSPRARAMELETATSASQAFSSSSAQHTTSLFAADDGQGSRQHSDELELELEEASVTAIVHSLEH